MPFTTDVDDAVAVRAAYKLAGLLEKIEQRRKAPLSDAVETARQEIIDDFDRRKAEFLAEFDKKREEAVYMDAKVHLEIIQQKADIASIKGLPQAACFLPWTTLLATMSLDMGNLGENHTLYSKGDSQILSEALANAKETLRLLDAVLAGAYQLPDNQEDYDGFTNLRGRAFDAITQFKTSLAYHKRLPDDVLREIFYWCIHDDPTVDIPPQPSMAHDSVSSTHTSLSDYASDHDHDSDHDSDDASDHDLNSDCTSSYMPDPSEVLSDGDLVDADFPYDGASEDEYADQPMQLVLTQICSRWRQIALATKPLWSDVCITLFNEQSMEYAQKWLSRAGDVPVSIMVMDVDMDMHAPELGTIFCDFFSAYHLKRLELPLYPKSHPQLSQFLNYLPPECTAQLEVLSFCVLEEHGHEDMFLYQSIFPSLREVDIAGNYNTCSWIMPWSTLRYLDASMASATVNECWKLLRKCTSLEVCFLRVLGRPPELETPSIELPNLRELSVNFASDKNKMGFFRPLVLPNLKNFYLGSSGACWTSRSDSILAFASNMNFVGLQHLDIGGIVSREIDLGELLRNMPSLKDLILPDSVRIDDETRTRLITCELGPCLEQLFISYAVEFLEIVAARTDNAKQQGWPILKTVVFRNKYGKVDPERESHYLTRLGEMGVKLIISHLC